MLNPDAGLRLMPSLTHMVAVVLLGGGVFLVQPASLSAQEQPADKTSPGQEERPAKPEDQSKAKAKEAEKEAKDRYNAIRGYEEAAKKLPPAAGAPECVWTGQRIASLLWRDDLGTASRYMDLYKQFDCSPDHLKLAFPLCRQTRANQSQSCRGLGFSGPQVLAFARRTAAGKRMRQPTQ